MTAPVDTIRNKAAAMLSTMRDSLNLSRAYLSAYKDALKQIPTAFVNEPREADSLMQDADYMVRMLTSHTRQFPRLLRAAKLPTLIPPERVCSPRHRADDYLLKAKIAMNEALAALDAHISLLKQLLDCASARQPELDSARRMKDETRRFFHLLARQHSFYSEA